ncbi:RNA polymerase sigma-70 factor [Antiquaquibacter soli]|uniref:RNA polymerase sigma-70 factor n=1 Tax=Antiquaquibacter soli TaxID=3064523 RepID=A0ABT9BQW1_9MICO|nr:RNA polymerase sigma-70 factor [Protaetiibacter sp. WY-16]MDO7882176.1 RNA polymerase sigma-70 factor [Protaetiibacter sp. WY-16]
MASVEVFEQQRPRLFGIAYRMLGSAAEAEDVVQDAWLRWQGTTGVVDNPGAFLATVVTRLCLNALDSARARRETYIGPWLPEPVDTSADPLLGAERAEALSLAALLLLERLTPAERAAYVLHEAFDYPFRQIAEVLEVSEANARQLGSRARKHLDSDRRAPVDPADRERLLGALLTAMRSGDIAALEQILAADVLVLSDGGGFVSAARKPILGRERVASFLVGVATKLAADVEFAPVAVNGEVATLGVRDGHPQSLTTVQFDGPRIASVYIVMNPAKIASLVPLAAR